MLQVTSQIFYYLYSPQLICQLQNLVGNSMKKKKSKQKEKGQIFAYKGLQNYGKVCYGRLI